MINPHIIRDFFVLEGLDGSGTTTQADMLAKRFAEAGRPCFSTCEPTKGPVGALIRSFLKGEKMAAPKTLAMLFAADRREHIYGESGIIRHTETADVVVSDRYLFSSLAYQSEECGFSFVYNLNQDYPLPEMLFFLDLDPELCVKRLADRENREIYETLEKQREVRGWYEKTLSAFANKGMVVERIDGGLPIVEISEKIWSCIRLQADNRVI